MQESTTVVSPLQGRTLFGHPIGLVNLFFTEMWERASFYGMRALLTLFLVDNMRGGFGLDDRTAAAIYGLYNAAVYMLSVPGGWIADRLLGAQRAVLGGGVIIALGHVLLGFATLQSVFFFGLLVIVLGTALLKPNISAIVAQLYPEGGARRDAGFTIFYMGINTGALIGPIACGWLALHYGWHAGFLFAAFGMFLGVAQFAWFRRSLGEAGLNPLAAQGDASLPGIHPHTWRWLGGIALGVAGMIALVWSGALPVAPVTLQHGTTWAIVTLSVLYFGYMFFGAGLTTAEKRRTGVLVMLFVCCAVFWSGFEQAGSSFNLFAERYTDRRIGGFEVPAAWFQSLNALDIVLFALPFAALWSWLGARKRDPSAPLKFTLGLVGMALGFPVIALAAANLAAGAGLVSMNWLIAVYLLHTLGELCLSPVGLSAFSKLAPARFAGQSLGVWFTATALGELIASLFAGSIDFGNLPAVPGQYMHIFWFGIVAAAAMLVLAPLAKRWSSGVH
jgi:POT family proton-dependent oligopeptide transporter